MKREPIAWITVNGNHVPIFEGETKEQAAQRFITEKQSVKVGDSDVEVHKDIDLTDENLTEEEIREEIKKRFVDEDSYIYSSEYEAINEALKEESRKKKELEARRDELQKIVDEGTIIDPEEVKEKGRALAKLFAKKTPEAEAADEELTQVDEDIKWADKTLEYKRFQLKNATPAEELRQDWKINGGNTMKEATKDDYEGFELDTHVSKYQDAVARGETVLMEMSPREYLERCAYDIFWERYGHTSTYEKQLFAAGMADAKYTQGLANLMKGGTKMYLPVLDYDDREQEGRHRAVAAMMLGIETIPVLVRLPKHRR